MFSSIAYTKLLGISVLAYGGLLAFIFLNLAIFAVILRKKGFLSIPYNAHPILAMISFILICIHGFIGFMAMLGY
jgi:ABC-type sugar transport system permease subunit